MKTDELERLIQAAPPGTQFEIVRITTPGAPCISPTQEVSLGPPAGESEWTPVQVVAWVREHHPSGLKLREWAEMPIGVSRRRLEAAAVVNELEWYPKTSGRDHGARMVSPDAMAAFLDRIGRLGEEPGQAEAGG